jgi:tyrosyl-tRNA synthetase
MASSRSEARRLIDQGGVKLNDQPVQSVTATVSDADLGDQGQARLAVGKKRHGLIKRA